MLLDRFRFEVKDLAGMPEAERVFTVLLGHISNEINMLQKLIMMAHDLDDEPDPPEIQGRTAQTMCLLRVLVGKLNEAHVTIKKRYLDAGLHMKIKDELDNQAVLALNTILDYFSRSDNSLNVLRKKISFHNDWEFVRTNLQSIPGDAGLFFYTDGTNGNTFFHFADLGVACMMANRVKPGDFAAGLDEITDKAVELAGCVSRFSSTCLGIMIGRHIKFAHDQVELRSARKLGEVRIPFFMVPVREPPV